MNQCYRNKHHRRLSQELEDATSEGMGDSSRPIVKKENLMASVVKAASVFSNVLLENCGMCTVYCDKQVQYEEYVQQQYDVGTGALGHLYSQLNATTATPTTATTTVGANNDNDNDVDTSNFINHNEMNTPPNNTTNPAMNNGRIEVERYYREFLFDEESVVRSVGSRGAADDEE